MTRSVILGGRTFVHVGQSTIAHDLHAMGLVRRAGLHDANVAFPGDTPSDVAQRVLGAAAESGVALELLGALLIPEGTDPLKWTIDTGRETAEYIGSIHDPPEKERVQGLIASVLADFCRAALVSSRASVEGSKETGGGRPGNSSSSSSGSGPRSSGSSPGPTTSGPSG